MRRFVLLRALVLVAAVASLFGAQTAHARVTARALPPTLSSVFEVPAAVRPGEAFDVSIAQPSTLVALDVYFEFDPAFIELVSVGLAPGAPAAFLGMQGAGGHDPDFLSFWLDPLPEGNAPLVVASFRALAPTPSTHIGVVLVVDGGDSDGGYTSPTLTRDVAVIPEPATAVPLLVGLCLAGGLVRRLRRG